MSLVERKKSNDSSLLMGYICCCPCVWTLALLCVCCSVKYAARIACMPCTSETVEEPASTITSNALSMLFSSDKPVKLLALQTNHFDPTDIFGFKIDNPFYAQLHTTLKAEIYHILDHYDFGTISVDQLTSEELTFIGEGLKAAIFDQLPTKAVFEAKASEAGIQLNDAPALQGVLMGILLNIINRTFIYEQMNLLGDTVLANRQQQAQVDAQTQRSVNAGLAAGSSLPVVDSTSATASVVPVATATMLREPLVVPVANATIKSHRV